MAALVDLTFATNETWFREITLKRAGAPIPLHSALIRMAGAPADGSGRGFRFTLGQGLRVANPNDGVFEISAAPALIADLAPGLYSYDVLVTVAGRTLRPLAGTLTVEQGRAR